MPVPESVRNVPRPVNSVVTDSGIDGPNRYAVRERAGIKYVPGGNPQPRNGKVIGHIRDGQFVPVEAPKADTAPEALPYGAAAFVRSVSEDIFSDLQDVFSGEDASMIMAIASLRVLKPGISSGRLAAYYNQTFLRRFYPGADLSPDAVSGSLARLGCDGEGRGRFCRLRARSDDPGRPVAIDGVLKMNDGASCDLSSFSYMPRAAGQEVFILYAYDIETGEPVCAEAFPGAALDADSFASFLRGYDIRNGVLIADRFPSVQMGEPEEGRALHFLTPTWERIERVPNGVGTCRDGVLEDARGEPILWKKQRTEDGKFLYAYEPAGKEAEEPYLFGDITFSSDADLDPVTVYRFFEERWLPELVFSSCMGDGSPTWTGGEEGHASAGSEFVDFIAAVLTCRMLKKATASGLLDQMSYGELLDDLGLAWRRLDAPENPDSGDKYWMNTPETVFAELEALGLSAPVVTPVHRKPGRPKKDPGTEKPKNPRGRPRKDP